MKFDSTILMSKTPNNPVAAQVCVDVSDVEHFLLQQTKDRLGIQIVDWDNIDSLIEQVRLAGLDIQVHNLSIELDDLPENIWFLCTDYNTSDVPADIAVASSLDELVDGTIARLTSLDDPDITLPEGRTFQAVIAAMNSFLKPTNGSATVTSLVRVDRDYKSRTLEQQAWNELVNTMITMNDLAPADLDMDPYDALTQWIETNIIHEAYATLVPASGLQHAHGQIQYDKGAIWIQTPDETVVVCSRDDHGNTRLNPTIIDLNVDHSKD